MLKKAIAIGFTALFIYSSFSNASEINLPRTGQTSSYAAGDDGAIKAGQPMPSPRFIDNGNGSITDNLTGLIWLKNANCTETVGGITKSSGSLTWANALIWCNNLAAGKCSLSDGSTAGQWRLPTRLELESLVDVSRYTPALPNGHPFTSVQSNSYWSSTTSDISTYAWFVNLNNGTVQSYTKTTTYYVLAVRGGQ